MKRALKIKEESPQFERLGPKLFFVAKTNHGLCYVYRGLDQRGRTSDFGDHLLFPLGLGFRRIVCPSKDLAVTLEEFESLLAGNRVTLGVSA